MKGKHVRRDFSLLKNAVFKFLMIGLFLSLFFLTSLSAQMEWICATDSAGWEGRDYFSTVSFDNKIWVLGGETHQGLKNDAWYSTDGINWIQANDSAGWSARCGHTAIVFDNKIWILGGGNDYGLMNDVWHSSDGVDWTQVTASSEWQRRYAHESIVFDDKIWVLGGQVGGIVYFEDDVWFSTGLGVSEEKNSSGATINTITTIHPNPFKTNIRIVYKLAKPTTVILNIYDGAGNKVKKLVGGEQKAGLHITQWDGRNDLGVNLQSGIYFLHLEAKDFSSVRKIVKHP